MPQAKKNDAVSKDVQDVPSTEIELQRTTFDTRALREINSFDDAMAILVAEGIEVDDASTEVGDSFLKLDDKNQLVDRPCLFMSWNFVKGDFGDFVVARVVASMPNNTVGKFAIVDGSTGLCKDLREYSESHGGKTGGLKALGGLTRSDYEVDLVDPGTGETKRTPATTYYVNTSK